MPLVRVVASAFVVGVLCSAAFAQTLSLPIPAPAFVDSAAAAWCLAGDGCTVGVHQPGMESTPPATCAADEALKAKPALQEREVRAYLQKDAVTRCRTVNRMIAPFGQEIVNAFDRVPAVPTREQAAMARGFADSCLTREFLVDAGAASEREETFLRQTVGLIVERHNRQWKGQRPICTAAAFGSIVITARSCLLAAVMQADTGVYLEDIAFRFFDRPTLYGLAFRRFGNGREASDDPRRDIAFLEIVNSPEIMLPAAFQLPIDEVRLHDELFTLVPNTFLQTSAILRSGANVDFSSVARLHHSTICRPAYIAPNSMFLHACQMGAVTRGTPFFQRRNGGLALVGIQGGVTETLPERSLASCAPGLPNYGIAIPPAVVLRSYFR